MHSYVVGQHIERTSAIIYIVIYSDFIRNSVSQNTPLRVNRSSIFLSVALYFYLMSLLLFATIGPCLYVDRKNMTNFKLFDRLLQFYVYWWVRFHRRGTIKKEEKKIIQKGKNEGQGTICKYASLPTMAFVIIITVITSK